MFKEVKEPGTVSSVSRLRKKVRDLERLLKRVELKGETKNTTAIARREQERALRALKDELRLAERHNRERKLDHKYRQVRFFERRKAVRRLERARKQLQKCQNESEIAGLEASLRTAETELAYIALFPKEKKYVSLYVGDGINQKENPVSDTDKRRREWWIEVEQRVKDGKVDISSLMFGNKQPRPAIVRPDQPDEEQQDEQDESEDEFFEK